MSVHSNVILKPSNPVGIFMRTTSCALFGRDWGALAPRNTPKTPRDYPAVALIQAALPKAALTNAMLADVLFPHRLAGASRSGACTSQPSSPNTDLSWSARAQGGSVLGEMDWVVGISQYH